MKLQLNYDSGMVTLNKTPLCFHGMLVGEMEKFPLREIISSVRKKKSIFFRINGNIEWDIFPIDVVVVEFNAGICHEVFIHFLPFSDSVINSIEDLEIVHVIQRNLKSQGVIKGRSHIAFPCSWGSINILYDIKVSAASIQLIYA